MFGSLIRKKAEVQWDEDEHSFESTTFTLSTAVPRPTERRRDARLLPTLRVAKLVGDSSEQLIRVRNISAGGLAAETAHTPPQIGEHVMVELSSQKIPSTVVWMREGMVGLKFDNNVDLGELLAGRKPRHGFRPRPPRLEVGCKASIRGGKVYYIVDQPEISLGRRHVSPL